MERTGTQAMQTPCDRVHAPGAHRPARPLRVHGRFLAVCVGTAVVGGAVALLGLVVVARAVFGAPTAEFVEFAGTTHTAAIGLIELSVGLVLVLAAATRSRLVVGATQSALMIGSVVLATQQRRVSDELAVTATQAWVAAALSGGVLAAIVAPERRASAPPELPGSAT